MDQREQLARTLVELEWGRPRRASLRADPLADLEQRIRETQVWCGQHLHAKAVSSCLRPANIAPPTLASDRWQLVDAVLKRRRLEVVPEHPSLRLVQGRLLVYFPDVDLGTTAALTESDGFFDAHTAPPWGTWIGFFEERNNRTAHASYLLAWVPSELQARVTRAMQSSAEECIQWATDATIELRPILEGLRAEPTNVHAPSGVFKGSVPQGNTRHN